MECKIIFILNTYFVWKELFFYEPEGKQQSWTFQFCEKKIAGMRFILFGFEPH